MVKSALDYRHDSEQIGKAPTKDGISPASGSRNGRSPGQIAVDRSSTKIFPGPP